MKKNLPIYSLCSLAEPKQPQTELMADNFSLYLDRHTDLHFPHKHSFYHLVYFTKASGSHSIDFVNFKAKPGQIYFMVPGQVHAWAFDGKPDGTIINFSEAFLHPFITDPRYVDQFSFFSGTAEDQVINIPQKNRPQIEQLLNTITEESKNILPLKDDMIRTTLIQLFVLVSRCSATPTQPTANTYNMVLLKSFQRLINEYYKEKNLTKEYASLLYVTPNHLNALSKDVTGKSAGELIRERILLEAKRLLINAGLTITEIAAELNFKDNSYFSRFFKKYTGSTPEAFRKKYH